MFRCGSGESVSLSPSRPDVFTPRSMRTPDLPTATGASGSFNCICIIGKTKYLVNRVVFVQVIIIHFVLTKVDLVLNRLAVEFE